MRYIVLIALIVIRTPKPGLNEFAEMLIFMIVSLNAKSDKQKIAQVKVTYSL